MGTISKDILDDHFGELIDRIEQGTHDEVRRAAHAVRNRARQNIVASDAIVTGNLWRSITVGETSDTQAEVYSMADYASYVHDGTEKMRARPFLTQAIEAQAEETAQRLKQMVEAGR